MGDPATALNSPHSIILTQKLATKYFGNTNPIGKTLTVENQAQFTITGVFRNIPANSMFTFSAVIPYSFFTLIAIFILLIACINFINLATAKASGRFIPFQVYIKFYYCRVSGRINLRNLSCSLSLFI